MAKKNESKRRAPFQVLVIPFRQLPSGTFVYGIFLREDASYWQGLAGGGTVGETPIEAARREAEEEAGITPSKAAYTTLDATATMPAIAIRGLTWGKKVIVIPEFSFAVEVPNPKLALSDEHTQYKWASYRTASKLLKWDSNQTALWELDYRLKNLPHSVTRL